MQKAVAGPVFFIGSTAVNLTRKRVVVREINISGTLTFLNVNKTSGRQGKYYKYKVPILKILNGNQLFTSHCLLPGTPYDF
jgi:hypothetical protein